MKLYQIAIGINHLYQTCLDQFKTIVPAGVEHIILIKNPYPEYNRYKSLRNQSEAIRLRLLSEQPEAMTVDADTTGLSWPNNLDRNKPLFSSPDGERINTGVIISFGHQEFFKKCLDEYLAMPGEFPNQIGMVIAKHRDEINLISQGYFYDINLSSVQGKSLSIASDNFCVVKDEKGQWQFTFLRGTK